MKTKKQLRKLRKSHSALRLEVQFLTSVVEDLLSESGKQEKDIDSLKKEVSSIPRLFDTERPKHEKWPNGPLRVSYGGKDVTPDTLKPLADLLRKGL